MKCQQNLAVGDKIDLSAIDANAQLVGNQAFSFIGNSAFTGVVGELRYFGNTIQGDVNGDQNSDFSILFSGVVLTANEFIL